MPHQYVRSWVIAHASSHKTCRARKGRIIFAELHHASVVVRFNSARGMTAGDYSGPQFVTNISSALEMLSRPLIYLLSVPMVPHRAPLQMRACTALFIMLGTLYILI